MRLLRLRGDPRARAIRIRRREVRRKQAHRLGIDPPVWRRKLVGTRREHGHGAHAIDERIGAPDQRVAEAGKKGVGHLFLMRVVLMAINSAPAPR